MRKQEDEYWNTSLPKNHEALEELDTYCDEWGGLTRAEATRRLLIEWAKLRKGKEVSSWVFNPSPRLAASGSSLGTRREPGGALKPSRSNTAAKAASKVLDE
jgi:hypothetical protein